MDINTDKLRKIYAHRYRRTEHVIRSLADEVDRLRRKDKICQDMIKQLVQMQHIQRRRKAA